MATATRRWWSSGAGRREQGKQQDHSLPVRRAGAAPSGNPTGFRRAPRGWGGGPESRLRVRDQPLQAQRSLRASTPPNRPGRTAGAAPRQKGGVGSERGPGRRPPKQAGMGSGRPRPAGLETAGHQGGLAARAPAAEGTGGEGSAGATAPTCSGPPPPQSTLREPRGDREAEPAPPVASRGTAG